jgi:hypothetical protein
MSKRLLTISSLSLLAAGIWYFYQGEDGKTAAVTTSQILEKKNEIPKTAYKNKIDLIEKERAAAGIEIPESKTERPFAKEESRAPASVRPTVIIGKSLRLGDSLHYQQVENVVAFKKGETLPQDAEVIEEKNGFVLATVSDEDRDEGLPVVKNRINQKLGVLTGVITVRYQAQEDAQTLAEDFGLTIVQEFAQVKLTLFNSDRQGVDHIVQLAESLKADKRVLKATPEVLENQRKSP